MWNQLINGIRGPFRGPGSYGRNAAFNVGQARPQMLASSDIRYTAKSTIDLKDAFAYAEADIKKFDRNGDGELSRSELTRIFKGNQQRADKYMTVLDTNKDGKLDASEVAAFVLFQDHSTYLLKSSVDAFVNAGLLSPEKGLILTNGYDNFSYGESSQADGKITAMERKMADRESQTAPNITLNIIRAMHAEKNLRAEYEKYRQKVDRFDQAS